MHLFNKLQSRAIAYGGLVIRMYKLLGNSTTELIQPSGLPNSTVQDKHQKYVPVSNCRLDHETPEIYVTI